MVNIKQGIQWPRKYDLLGVTVSATTYEEASSLIIRAAQQKMDAVITHLPVHGVVLANKNLPLKSKIDSFEIVAPDGQPVRWALNFLYSTRLPDSVRGRELMVKVCQQAAEIGIGIYLYGSQPQVVENLRKNLLRKFPQLQVVGWESPPFRPLTPEEDNATIERINNSNAGIVFLGLGCPKQDVFAYEHRHRLKAVQLCVGAAFDFLSCNKIIAPHWMQQRGLEWLFRLLQEPRRLYRRYFITNTIFLVKIFSQILKHKL